jgi:branched-chain amino acid transport system substrate-binding protein
MRKKLVWCAAALLIASMAARAELVIGQTAGFSGTVAASVKEAHDGAMLYIAAVNKRGGVHGEQIRLVSRDDRFDPAVAKENARKLIVDDHVIALFLTRGTPHTEAILPLLSEFEVPLVAPSSGAMSLHRPVNKWVYNVRAPYQREAERAVHHLLSMGADRIAVVRVDDSFGKDAVEGVHKGFEGTSKGPVLDAQFSREKWDFTDIKQKVMASNVQAIVFLGSGKAVVDGVAALRAAGSLAQIVTLSNNASTGFVASLGSNGPGIIITQVFPSERSLVTPLAREAASLAGSSSEHVTLTPAMMEGFAAAKVLVAGLERAGPHPTGVKLQQALDGLKHLDIGGLEIDFSPTRHTGLEFVDLSIVSADGTLRR